MLHGRGVEAEQVGSCCSIPDRGSGSICTVSAKNLALKSGRSYRPPPMQRSVPWSKRWSSGVRWIALATAGCSLLLAGCGRSAIQASAGRHRQVARPPAGTPVSAPGTQLTFQPKVVNQVVSGWLAAESAFADAARTSDPYAPELAATTIDPQLAWSRSLLERMGASGEIATGQSNYGTPRVVALHGNRATVRTCARDAEITVFAATGKPAPGIPGRVDFELFISTMEQTEGGWKLLTQKVGTGQCDRL